MQNTSSVNSLLVLVAVQFGVICALTAGFLNWVDEKSLPSALLYGGGAFAGGVLFTFAIIRFWTGKED